MGNYKLDREKIKKLIAENKSVPEIVAETGYKLNSLRTVLRTLGLKSSKDGRGRKLGSVNKIKNTGATNDVGKPAKPKTKTEKVIPFFPNKDANKITALDMLIAERNGYQDRIFKINKAIEILQ